MGPPTFSRKDAGLAPPLNLAPLPSPEMGPGMMRKKFLSKIRVKSHEEKKDLKLLPDSRAGV